MQDYGYMKTQALHRSTYDKSYDQLHDYVKAVTGSPYAAGEALDTMDDWREEIIANVRKWPPNDTTLMTSADWVH